MTRDWSLWLQIIACLHFPETSSLFAIGRVEPVNQSVCARGLIQDHDVAHNISSSLFIHVWGFTMSSASPDRGLLTTKKTSLSDQAFSRLSLASYQIHTQPPLICWLWKNKQNVPDAIRPGKKVKKPACKAKDAVDSRGMLNSCTYWRVDLFANAEGIWNISEMEQRRIDDTG